MGAVLPDLGAKVVKSCQKLENRFAKSGQLCPSLKYHVFVTEFNVNVGSRDTCNQMLLAGWIIESD